MIDLSALTDTLVPTFEIKLSINKESVHDFISAWTYYYEKLAKFDQLTEHFSPKKQAEHDIRKQIETKFNSYLWSDVTL